MKTNIVCTVLLLLSFCANAQKVESIIPTISK